MEFMPIFNSVGILLLGAALTFIATRYWHNRTLAINADLKLSEANEKLLNRIAELEKQNAIIGQAMIPINALVQAALIRELTHNHTPEMDDLLARIGSLDELEEARLYDLLKERVVDFNDPLITQSEREAAIILPYIMRRAAHEALEMNRSSTITYRVTTITVRKPPVLIAEDNENLARTYRRILETAGVNAEYVTSGEDVIDLLKKEAHPRLLIVDIGLPDMSGIDLARMAKDEGYKGNIVAVSGAANYMDLTNLGLFVDAAQKPVTKDELIRLVKKWSL